jgi:heme exporter protein B
MGLAKEIWNLLHKELILELRMGYALGGILLYVLSTVFIVFSSFVQLPSQTWNILFWIVLLFASVNAITKSFVQESGARALYYYTLVNPIAALLAKILYNTLFLLLISGLIWGFMSFFAGNPVRDAGLFLLAMFLGSTGLSIAFTFLSAISGKAGNNATLLAVLSFPLVIPLVMTLVKISAIALRLLRDTAWEKDLLTLAAIDLLLLGMGLLLFPFLWKD